MNPVNSEQIHYRTCNLCEAMCGIEIKVRDNRVLSIKGDKSDPFSQGHICPKATALQDVYEDPDRLKRPIRRTASGHWEEISWDEAFDEVAAQIKRVQAEYGRNAIGVYQGNPNVHNFGTMLYSPQFVRALKTKSRYSATSVDQLPHHFAAYFMYGHQFMIPIPDIDRTNFMLILGANPLTSNGSLMTAPDTKRRLKAIQKRGGQIVVIDPRRSETAEMADAHHFIRPGTDVLLLAALINTILAEELTNLDRLMSMIDGGALTQVEAALADFTAERVAPITGIPADHIRQMARDFAAADQAVCYGRMGTSTQAFGGVCNWLINVLNIVTGNLDRPGGAMFTLPAFDVVGITTGFGSKGSLGRWHTRVRKLPEFSGELPVSALAEEILTPGEGQIKLMVTVAGNPVLSTPNGAQLDEAFASVEYMVAVDIYLNETTRHANIILPPATGLETPHYDLIFHALAVRNTAKYSPPVFEKEDGMLFDWEIFAALRDHLLADTPAKPTSAGKKDLFTLPPEKILDVALRNGPYGYSGGRLYFENGNGLSLRELNKNPHGIDLGPMQACLPQRLGHSNRQIDLAPELFIEDMTRVADEWLQKEVGLNGHFYLIGRRQLRSNNSWMHNAKRLVKGKNRCTLLLHPEDAAAIGVENSQMARVTSRVGQVDIEVEVSNEMMRGVVSIPHGWGHDRKGVRLQTAAQYAGVSINDLTDDLAIDPLTGNAAFSGVPVEVKPLTI